MFRQKRKGVVLTNDCRLPFFYTPGILSQGHISMGTLITTTFSVILSHYLSGGDGVMGRKEAGIIIGIT